MEAGGVGVTVYLVTIRGDAARAAGLLAVVGIQNTDYREGRQGRFSRFLPSSNTTANRALARPVVSPRSAAGRALRGHR
jgi:hypothetical protein